jgi:hypothetical protein
MEKTAKKKSDKLPVANPPISSGDASSVTCQICSMNHNATDCPRLQAMMQDDAIKRGELFPGKSNKDGKWKGVKAGQGFESNEDTDHKLAYPTRAHNLSSVSGFRNYIKECYCCFIQPTDKDYRDVKGPRSLTVTVRHRENSNYLPGFEPMSSANRARLRFRSS